MVRQPGPGDHVGTRRLLRPAALAPILLVCGAFTAYVLVRGLARNPYGFMDLDVYRLAVDAWLHGNDMYGAIPPTHHGNQLHFLYPPFAALPLAPFAEMSWSSAWITMGMLSLGALAVVLYLVARRVWPGSGARGAVLLTGLALPCTLFLEPVQETLWYGQINLLLMALVVADCLVAKPAWPRGVLIGLAAAVKITPAGFLLFFLLRKDFSSTARGVITAVVATAVGFAVNWDGSLRLFSGDTALGRAADTAYATNQTIKAALERLYLAPALQDGLWLGISALAVGLAVLGVLRAFRADHPALAMVIVAGTLLAVSPTAWGHHWVYAAPAALVLLAHGVRYSRPSWVITGAIVAAAFVLEPFYWCPVLPGADGRMHWSTAEHLYGNTYVLLTLVLLGCFSGYRLRRRRHPPPPEESDGVSTVERPFRTTPHAPESDR